MTNQLLWRLAIFHYEAYVVFSSWHFHPGIFSAPNIMRCLKSRLVSGRVCKAMARCRVFHRYPTIYSVIPLTLSYQGVKVGLFELRPERDIQLLSSLLRISLRGGRVCLWAPEGVRPC